MGRQAELNNVLGVANIPALSMAWSQASAVDTLSGGVTDNSNPGPVNDDALFQGEPCIDHRHGI